MNVLKRIARFVLPLREFHIEEHHFHPEHDEHLQWMNAQRRSSERRVRDEQATGNFLRDALLGIPQEGRRDDA